MEKAPNPDMTNAKKTNKITGVFIIHFHTAH